MCSTSSDWGMFSFIKRFLFSLLSSFFAWKINRCMKLKSSIKYEEMANVECFSRDFLCCSILQSVFDSYLILLLFVDSSSSYLYFIFHIHVYTQFSFCLLIIKCMQYATTGKGTEKNKKRKARLIEIEYWMKN